MKISVVTVTYNSQATLGDTIRSFLDQRHPDKELLIADGGSKDETLALAHSFDSPDISIVSEPDQGPFDAMNKGLARFTGEAVGVLNSDDTFHDPNSLGRIAEGLADADVVYGDIDMVSDHQTKTVMRSWKPGPFRRSALRYGWMPPHPSVYVRRRVVERIGGFATQYRLVGDYDFTMRALLQEDFRVRYIPHVLADFKLGGLSTADWRATVEGNLDCLRVRRERLGAGFVDAALFLRPLRKLFELRRVRGYYEK